MRIIPRLDIKNDWVIKGVNLEGLRKIDKAIELIVKYKNQNPDEILLMDAVASLYDRNNLYGFIREVSQEFFYPITLGGGLRSVSDVEKALKSGCDKISLNTQALETPNLVDEIINEFGSQALVLSVEIKKINDDYFCYYNTGRDNSKKLARDWIIECCDKGIGELLFTSIDYEGMQKGPDLKLIEFTNNLSSVPTIYHGGIRNRDDIQLIKSIFPSISGVALASALHYNNQTIESLR